MIKKYQKRLSQQQYNSNRYKDTLKTYWKWMDRKKNKINDYYHKITTEIVKKYDIINTRRPKHKRNVSKPTFKPKITKNRMEKIC